ncbi:MAG: alpha/beta fold hydrolase [Candidatus Sericytochromatia bacterium]|nr:alpha/beta fold hydrolase [Candidatus Sericytochromatia bacterium]
MALLGATSCARLPTPPLASRWPTRAVAASAVDRAEAVDAALVAADLDRDGVLSGAETGFDVAQFKAFDRDRSGAIEPAEWRYPLDRAGAEALLPAFEPMVRAVQAQADADRDGRVSRREWRALTELAGWEGALDAFAAADGDGDGQLAAPEARDLYLALGGLPREGRGLAGTVGRGLLGAYFGVVSRIAVRKACFPKRLPIKETPARFGLAYEPVVLQAEDGLTLRGWYIPARVPTPHTVLLYHGIDDTRASYVRHGQVAMLAPHANQLVMDLRCHGESEGTLTTYGLHETRDVAAALRWLEARGLRSVAIYGTSLGGATAIRGAALHPGVRGLVDDCAFATVQQAFSGFIAAALLPSPVLAAAATIERVRRVYGVDLREAEPIRHIARVAPRPMLIVHGAQDPLVAPENSRMLYLTAGSGVDKELWLAPGAGHANSAVHQPAEFERRLVGFVARAFAQPAPGLGLAVGGRP